MTEQLMHISDFPPAVLEEIQRDLSSFTVGFSEIIGHRESEDIMLLGTGTLVKVGNCHAIITAQHVLKRLPSEDRIGLIMSKTVRRETIDVKGINCIEIARGSNDRTGPDLGVVLLSAPVAAAIAARKNFYDLAKHKERALVNPPDSRYGVWCNIGFIDERTVERLGEEGYQKIKEFFMYAGFGGPDEAPIRSGEFDYLSMPVTYDSNSEIPLNFGGISGGGLWQIQLIQEKEQVMKAGELLLSGVVFYQEEIKSNRRNIISHFRNSIYKTVYEVIENQGNQSQ